MILGHSAALTHSVLQYSIIQYTNMYSTISYTNITHAQANSNKQATTHIQYMSYTPKRTVISN